MRAAHLVPPLVALLAASCRGPDAAGVEILPGGRAFRLDGRTHPIPGAFSIPREQVAGVPVTNRDTVGHAVGVTVVMAGVRFSVPPDQCSSNDSGPRRVFIVR